MDISLDDFWLTHYNFNNSTKKKTIQLSTALIDLININALIPFEFALGRLKGNENQMKFQIKSLASLKPEKNAIIAKWNEIGIKGESAFETQGLIEQKNNLCNEKKCLFCAIGKQLLSQ